MTIPHPQTREFQQFQTNLKYARKMVLAGQGLSTFQPRGIDIDDFYRAAWVQAVSAIDHWFHEVLFRRVAELTAEDSPNMPHQLTRFELPLAKVEEVQRGTVTLAEAVTEHVRAKWGSASLQNPRKISEALKLITEEDIWAKAAAQINTWNHNRTSLNAQGLKKQYISITERRNKIAHASDIVEGDSKERTTITDADVNDTIDWIERIALAISTVVG